MTDSEIGVLLRQLDTVLRELNLLTVPTHVHSAFSVEGAAYLCWTRPDEIIDTEFGECQACGMAIARYEEDELHVKVWRGRVGENGCYARVPLSV